MNPSPRVPRSGRQHSGDTGQALFVLGMAAGLLAALALDRAARYFFDSDIELVRAVRDMAREEFVREVDEGELVDNALEGMLKGLDNYSHYYGPPEVSSLERETSGEFLGIGVVFLGDELGRVLFPYPGSPAEAAGLRVGDLIVSTEGRPMDSMGAEEFQKLLHREDGEVHLGVKSLEGELRQVSVRPEVVLDPTVRQARMEVPEQGIGYLSIRSFSHRTPQEFDEAVDELKTRGMRSLVLDLRANPGGILDSAVAIANRFIASGAIVATRSRQETHVTRASAEKATLAGLPLVLLMDGYSASASEVLAAALQDHGVAALVGEPSYGKGMVQTLKRIGREHAVVKLTTATYCSPSLRRIEHDDKDAVHSGIAPDLWVPLSGAEREAVHRYLFGISPPEGVREEVRAWETREDLHLIDDPPKDRQLEAALALLSEVPLELHGDPLQ